MISYEKIIRYNTSKEGVKCMVCQHCYFKDKFDYQPYVCNKCHDFPMTVIRLGDFFVVAIKNADYRVYISNINNKEALHILNCSKLGDKGVLSMEFHPNISPVDVINIF